MPNAGQIITAGAGNGRDLSVPGQSLVAPAGKVDLHGSIFFFRRRRGLILMVTLLALAIGALITWMQPAIYTATATVSLESPPEQVPKGAEGVAQSGPSPSSAYVDTQVEILESRELAHRVAGALGLLAGKSAAEQEAVAVELQSGVDAERAGESHALKLSYATDDGQLAARTVNEYARQYTQWELVSTRDRNRQTMGLVSSRLDQLRDQAHADTQALQQYRIANNLLSTSGASLTEQEISAYNQEVTRARAQAAEDDARLNTALQQLRSGSTGEDVGEALGSSVINGLRAREAEVGGQVANFEARYGPNHPQLVRAKGELEEIRRQIQAEIKRVVSNLDAKRKVSSQRLASLSGSLGSARGTLAQNNAAMVGLDELERKAQASQALYETYLNSFKTLAAEEGTERPNARVLSYADVPMLPSSPNVAMNMVLALVIGLGAGLVAAYIAEALFHGVTTADEVEHDLGHRYLGSIPLLASVSRTARREVPAITEEPRSAFAEAFRSLRTSIEQAVHGPAQVIAVTSALPNEGKTTISSCLAQTLAVGGARTVLVDCDLRRRGVSRLLRLDPGHPGLIEVLEGKATLSDALVAGETGLYVLTIQPSDSEPESLLVGETFAEMLAQLRQHFDHVVLDLPPVLPIAAARSLAAQADATVLVVRWRKTVAGAVRSALLQLPPDRVNVVGITINNVDMRRRQLFSHSDPAFFYDKYRQYYA